jgi:hypothetical protein
MVMARPPARPAVLAHPPPLDWVLQRS